eukprot:1102054-Prorocentrum_minimum.AAC.1
MFASLPFSHDAGGSMPLVIKSGHRGRAGVGPTTSAHTVHERCDEANDKKPSSAGTYVDPDAIVSRGGGGGGGGGDLRRRSRYITSAILPHHVSDHNRTVLRPEYLGREHQINRVGLEEELGECISAVLADLVAREGHRGVHHHAPAVQAHLVDGRRHRLVGWLVVIIRKV